MSAVVQQLFHDYYDQRKARAVGASSHWLEFAKHFDVDVNTAGQATRLEGFGFGAARNASIPQRAFTEAFVATQVGQRRLSGLREALPAARRTVAAMGLSFSQDSFRQVATATLIGSHADIFSSVGGSPRTIMVIGDGPGTLSALLHEKFPDAQIWLVDLGPTLLFQAAHLGRAFPDAVHVLASDARSARNATFLYCPAESYQHLPEGTIDLAANVASMQEMAPQTVTDYFSFLRERRTRLFYCCNRVEKKLPGGEISRFFDYPWQTWDEHLVDEACPWHQWFVGTATSPHVRRAGIPLPLVHKYDGVHWHRLSRLDRNH